MSHRYLLFYKPFNVLCQFTNPDELACPTLKNFIDVPDVYSVGRLDRDSEGLLLLTNHGAMKHRLTHPQFHHPRTYWVQVERCPKEAAMQQLRDGVMIKGGYQTRPAQVQLLDGEPSLPTRDPPIRFRKTVPTAWLSLSLTEGRNRQVRRMTAVIGHPTLRLVRVGMGRVEMEANARLSAPSSVSENALQRPAASVRLDSPGLITLGDLQPGQWRDLTATEVQQLSQLWKQGLAAAPAAPRRRGSAGKNRSRRS